VINTANPMQGVSIPRGAEPIDTHAYSLEEITGMLAILDGPARVLVATAAFTWAALRDPRIEMGRF